jgi:hypothetical protein
MDFYNGRPAPSIQHSIIVIVAPLDRRGRFSVRFDGRSLVSASRLPFCDGARELVRLGYQPELVLLMRHEGSSAVALRSTIGEAAKLTVEDSDRGPPGFRAWKPFISPEGSPGMPWKQEQATDGHSGAFNVASARPALAEERTA